MSHEWVLISNRVPDEGAMGVIKITAGSEEALL